MDSAERAFKFKVVKRKRVGALLVLFFIILISDTKYNCTAEIPMRGSSYCRHHRCDEVRRARTHDSISGGPPSRRSWRCGKRTTTPELSLAGVWLGYGVEMSHTVIGIVDVPPGS